MRRHLERIDVISSRERCVLSPVQTVYYMTQMLGNYWSRRSSRESRVVRPTTTVKGNEGLFTCLDTPLSLKVIFDVPRTILSLYTWNVNAFLDCTQRNETRS